MKSLPQMLLMLLFAGCDLALKAADDPAPKRYVITDSGAAGDGKSVNTKAIQAAIDLCAKNGGGVIVVPKGTFLSGALIRDDAESVRRQRNIQGLAGGHCAAGIADDSLHAVLGILLADQTAGESIGIAAIAFDPDFHAVFFAFRDGGLHEVHILGRKIRRTDAAGVIDHIDSAATGVDLVDIRDDALPCLRAAPDGPVNGAIFRGRLWKDRREVIERRHRNLPVGWKGAKWQGETNQQGETEEYFQWGIS